MQPNNNSSWLPWSAFWKGYWNDTTIAQLHPKERMQYLNRRFWFGAFAVMMTGGSLFGFGYSIGLGIGHARKPDPPEAQPPAPASPLSTTTAPLARARTAPPNPSP